MFEYMQDTGLYWRPLGGNNIDQISGHCYQYTGVLANKSGCKYSTILVDLGKFDNHQALGIKNSIAAVADIRDILQNKKLNLKGLLLTHSHPDHLNGIIHYIRAGYKLPTLYGGRYTKMILDDLYRLYQIGKTQQPSFAVIKDGDKIKCGMIEIEAVSVSHTCFDALGFIIKHQNTTVFHSGDMKIDQTTFFRRPTNLKRLAEKSNMIDYVVADFYGIDNNGTAWREADVLKTLTNIIKKTRKKKIFLPVYPTHAEMYIIAFLAALKLKKNVIFYGTDDFYDYLKLIKKYGIDFEKIAGNNIKVSVGIPEDMKTFNDDFVVIGAFNDIEHWFDESPKNSFAFITARTYFNPLKGQMNSRNIKFVTLNEYPILQGAGHGFLSDWEKILKILPNAVYIPTHCPCFVAESFCPLGKDIGFNLIKPTPKNNNLFRFCAKEYKLLSTQPATWLVAKDDASFTEVWQKATSGAGFLKRTFSRRRTQQKFNMMLCQRRKK